MVQRTLELWATCRVIERSWVMCGEDTLGVERIEDPTSPWRGTIPITPTMDTQLDQIVIQSILVPLQQRILRELQAKIQVHKPEAWFEIYLTIFTLLSSIEVGSAHSNRFAKRYGCPVCISKRLSFFQLIRMPPARRVYLLMLTSYSQNRFSDMKLVEGWFHTSNVLLSRFHFVCNGSTPLHIDWGIPGTARFAKLESEQVKFMEDTKVKIKENGTKEGYFASLSSILIAVVV